MTSWFPFNNRQDQRDAQHIGMWIFIASELLLFGSLFLAILVVRASVPEGAQAASDHLDMRLGGLNTAILLTSSYLVALGIAQGKAGRKRAVSVFLGLAALLGVVFLAIKIGIEYRGEAADGLFPGVGPPFPLPEQGAELFFNLYLIATSLHAIHLVIGISLLTFMAFSLRPRNSQLEEKQSALQFTGLFWHLVDVIWIFLYPSLYLVS